MKRFWTAASVRPQPEGYAVYLDAKPVRLPSGGRLCVIQPALAQALAAEWDAAPAEFSAADMPLTGLAATLIERVVPDPEPTVAALAKYGAYDLLCYRAAEPPELAAAQARDWQPWLDWAAEHHGAPLAITTGIVAIAQPPRSLAALRAALTGLDAPGLAALGVAVPALGSLILGLALIAGELDADAAHALATLDERFQQSRWGSDGEAASRHARIGAELALAARFNALCAA